MKNLQLIFGNMPLRIKQRSLLNKYTRAIKNIESTDLADGPKIVKALTAKYVAEHKALVADVDPNKVPEAAAAAKKKAPAKKAAVKKAAPAKKAAPKKSTKPAGAVADDAADLQ